MHLRCFILPQISVSQHNVSPGSIFHCCVWFNEETFPKLSSGINMWQIITRETRCMVLPGQTTEGLPGTSWFDKKKVERSSTFLRSGKCRSAGLPGTGSQARKFPLITGSHKTRQFRTGICWFTDPASWNLPVRKTNVNVNRPSMT